MRNRCTSRNPTITGTAVMVATAIMPAQSTLNCPVNARSSLGGEGLHVHAARQRQGKEQIVPGGEESDHPRGRDAGQGDRPHDADEPLDPRALA
jgi:hypothetical protein